MPGNTIVKDKSLKGSDWAYLDELKKIAKEKDEKQKQIEANELLSIVCIHILFAVAPQETYDLKVTPAHPKHDGHCYCCKQCATVFELFTIADAQETFVAEPKRKFEKNILTVKTI